jgi:voltage-gated potassium channel
MRWLAECRNAIHWGYELIADLGKARNLGYLGLIAGMAALGVGLLLYLVDPSVRSPLDGIWSAWVTMTHVGFGDVVPTSFFGRLLAAGLILLGLVLFSVFTATLSVALIGRNMAALASEVERDTSRIETEENRILKELATLQLRMEGLEANLRSLSEKVGA